MAAWRVSGIMRRLRRAGGMSGSGGAAVAGVVRPSCRVCVRERAGVEGGGKREGGERLGGKSTRAHHRLARSSTEMHHRIGPSASRPVRSPSSAAPPTCTSMSLHSSNVQQVHFEREKRQQGWCKHLATAVGVGIRTARIDHRFTRHHPTKTHAVRTSYHFQCVWQGDASHNRVVQLRQQRKLHVVYCICYLKKKG